MCRIMFNNLGAMTWDMGLFDRLRGEDHGDVLETHASTTDFGNTGNSYPSDPSRDVSRDTSNEGAGPSPNTNLGSSSSDGRDDSLGISELMGKRVKLEEAVDYVGVMITNLRDKRTGLEKEIEDESVEIKNIREKLIKVQEYIDGERRGLESLKERRVAVDASANEATERMNVLRTMISELDGVVNSEAGKTRNFKESQINPRESRND